VQRAAARDVVAARIAVRIGPGDGVDAVGVRERVHRSVAEGEAQARVGERVAGGVGHGGRGEQCAREREVIGVFMSHPP
jgi:hypothetical protein